MLTLQKNALCEIACTPADCQGIDQMLEREWLLTNNRGGYASSTVVGCNTRRYHGLLIGSLDPPVNRINALTTCMEKLLIDSKLVDLSTFEFDQNITPDGFKYIKQFRKDTGVHFDYQIENIEMTKSLYLFRDTDAIILVYDFKSLPDRSTVELLWRPYVSLCDFHSLQKSYASLRSQFRNDTLSIRHDAADSSQLYITARNAKFEKDRQWWFNFVYRKDKERGHDFTGDLWTPGFFRSKIKAPCQVIFRAELCGPDRAIDKTFSADSQFDITAIQQDLLEARKDLIEKAEIDKNDDQLPQLCIAADDFIVEVQRQGETRTSILAGFPWFADWGRDAFISLPGLLLSTGRFSQAKSVLSTFAAAADQGMIPNRFDDYNNQAHFNSIDASLWFINASFQYLLTTGDYETFTDNLLPVILEIVEFYQKGTRFGIHADSDGLITAGSEETQLTWMDAKCENIAFTPRYGKAVEINALWYNSLCALAHYYKSRDDETCEHYTEIADKVKNSFRQLFWNQQAGYLNDCILPDGTVDSSLRPNQIFAVSLAFSPLTKQMQNSVIQAVEDNLLTDYGLRTLSDKDPRYQGRYQGHQFDRDKAYHQGTVWPYLIGHFVQGYLKVNAFSRDARKQAEKFIEPLLAHLTEQGCLGHICEIFDGDSPQRPKGCFAQAWSIAELIRAYELITADYAGNWPKI